MNRSWKNMLWPGQFVLFARPHKSLLHDKNIRQLTLSRLHFLWEIFPPCFESCVQLTQFLELRLLTQWLLQLMGMVEVQQ